MLSIEESRKILGKLAKNMSNKEVEKVRNDLYRMINLILDERYEKSSSNE